MVVRAGFPARDELLRGRVQPWGLLSAPRFILQPCLDTFRIHVLTHPVSVPQHVPRPPWLLGDVLVNPHCRRLQEGRGAQQRPGCCLHGARQCRWCRSPPGRQGGMSEAGCMACLARHGAGWMQVACGPPPVPSTAARDRGQILLPVASQGSRVAAVLPPHAAGA